MSDAPDPPPTEPAPPGPPSDAMPPNPPPPAPAGPPPTATTAPATATAPPTPTPAAPAPTPTAPVGQAAPAAPPVDAPTPWAPPAGGPAWAPPAGGATWPPGPRAAFGPAPAGVGRGPTDAGAASTLVGSAITLALGAVVAGVLFAVGDAPGDYFGSDMFQTAAATLAALAAPVALLLAWDEVDLSSFGTAALGSYIYVELADDSVLPGLVVAALVGLVAGAAIGLVRWLTGAHSALVSLGAGALLSGLAFHFGPGLAGAPLGGSRIDDPGLAILSMLAITGLAVGLALIFGTSSTSAPAPSRRSVPGLAGPQVIPAFALSGLAASLFGAFLSGSIGFYAVGQTTYVIVLVFTAVAIGGVVRGSGPIAPLAAALGAGMAVVVQDSALFNRWNPGEQQIALGGLFVVCVVVAHGLRRIMAPARPGGTF